VAFVFLREPIDVILVLPYRRCAWFVIPMSDARDLLAIMYTL
jgi:hypothetical protein